MAMMTEQQVRLYFDQQAVLTQCAETIAWSFAPPNRSISDVHFGDRTTGVKGQELIEIIFEMYICGSSETEIIIVPLEFLWVDNLESAIAQKKIDDEAKSKAAKEKYLKDQLADAERRERVLYEQLRVKYET